MAAKTEYSISGKRGLLGNKATTQYLLFDTDQRWSGRFIPHADEGIIDGATSWRVRHVFAIFLEDVRSFHACTVCP